MQELVRDLDADRSKLHLQTAEYVRPMRAVPSPAAAGQSAALLTPLCHATHLHAASRMSSITALVEQVRFGTVVRLCAECPAPIAN